MQVKIVHNSKKAYEFLKNKIRFNYIYQFYNLEKVLWEKTICYGLFDNSELKEIAMVSLNYDIPVLLAASFENAEYNIELISRIKSFLPPSFYTHIDKATLERVFSKDSITDSHEYMNMGLCHYSNINNTPIGETVRLGYNKLDDIKELLKVSHPDAWLDDELVKLGKNFGAVLDHRIVSFAGIHAYSKDYKIAAVAHVTTHPQYRRKGYCEKVVLDLLRDLREDIDFIGLNVKVDNLPAINCYKNLGFKEFGRFMACEVKIKE